ncbi:MAG TPA: arginine--tRNA ligase [Candidatus Staskawiczbacteria bacterium]|nr:arginine--tRNA ligase [Candidatus Staskawiczbacteria bacterium]
MIRGEAKKIILRAITGLKKEEGFEKIPDREIIIEHPNEKIRGDYSCSVAFGIAKEVGKNPFEVATLLKLEIEKQKHNFSKIEVVNGFLNFFVSEKYLQKQVARILKEKNKFGSLDIGKNKKINIEFISANPTGPLTLGNGRGGFGGDVLANVLEKAGYKPTREYYINDTGNQVKVLGHSVLGDAEAVYKGEYILQLQKKIKGKNPEAVGEKAAKEILNKMIKPSVKKMGVEFDVWFSEKNLYENKEVDKAIAVLKKKGFTYESEGAVWFKSKDLGDDKDRVLIRKDGIRTYFASDIAYLKNKFGRKFTKLILFVGADHHGYVARLKAAAYAMGYDREKIDMVVLQLVKLFENGQEVRMSKRAGTYVTIDELIDEVGVDVARFFFLMTGLNTHMNFNLDLAKEKSEKNPVFKVQYAYARICSILKKAGTVKKQNINFDLLKDEAEFSLVREFLKLSEVIEDSSNDYQLQRLPQYALELAECFHKFYENCKVISQDKELTIARLQLVLAAKIVLKNTLDLIGVSAPEKM